jgi:peroxiredoxin family protein
MHNITNFPKKSLFAFLMILGISYMSFSQDAGNCGATNKSIAKKALKLGIVIYSNDAETVWNAFRLANYSMSFGDTVSVFLLGKGVEAQKVSTTDFDIKGQMDDFAASGGKIFACGTCLQLRNQEGTNLCPVSSLSDLYDIIKTSEKILTF